MSVSDPTDALATALHTQYCKAEDGPADVDHDNATAILAALPEGTAIVTVDSLAAALDRLYPMDRPDEPRRHATAIIKAAREAERDHDRPTARAH